jgi:hypothetical protein
MLKIVKMMDDLFQSAGYRSRDKMSKVVWHGNIVEGELFFRFPFFNIMID